MTFLDLNSLEKHFPYPEMRDVQRRALAFVADSVRGALLEQATGSGKSGVGIAVIRAFAAQDSQKRPCFYVTPTKTQTAQIEALFPNDVVTAQGRSEFPCLYYTDQGQELTAEQSPCYMLTCGHRLNMETGETEKAGAEPCPYFQQKLVALRRSKEGSVVLTTTAFFLMNRLLVKEWRDADPGIVVLDEAHRIARITRGLFEYNLTDYSLLRTARILTRFDKVQAGIIVKFVREFRRIARKRPPKGRTLLKQEEIDRLLGIIEELNKDLIENAVRAAVASGDLNPLEQKEDLKLLENLIRNIPRLVRSFTYAAEALGRRPLNFVVAFYYKQDDPEFKDSRKKARYHVTIRSYFVAPLIKKAMGDRIVAYSATIGNPDIFKFETGIELPFRSFPSTFSVDQTRVYLPEDTPNLALKARRRNDLNRSLRMIVRNAHKFALAGHRSLIIVVSDEERQKVLTFAKEIGLVTVTYGNGRKARDAAADFVKGEGQVLVGTTANYAEGVDLPRGAAPVIFFLRPGYKPPDDPETQFERTRFSEGQCWALWNHNVMIEALQVRGRNIRGPDDVGVCFFISQGFRRILYGALPEWLKPAYRGAIKMDDAVEETLKLLR